MLILRSQGRNLPSFAGGMLSTIRPIVTSVKASVILAPKNRSPTAKPLIPSTFV